jgi:hypothetical protein
MVKHSEGLPRFLIVGNSHLTHGQVSLFNEMLESLKEDEQAPPRVLHLGTQKPLDLGGKIGLFLQILIPHCLFRYLECAVTGSGAAYQVHK